MSHRATLIDAGASTSEKDAAAVVEAIACLNRFTAAFNAGNLAGMDAELHFPHTMLFSAQELTWTKPGQHPTDLFESLHLQGWAYTQYERVEPVLASFEKVHFSVTYSRRRADCSVLPEHRNLWVVVRRSSKWGIVWRSY